VLTVSLSAASSRTVTVDYATANVNVIASSDYSGVAGNLTFAPGTRTIQIAVPILGDTLEEPNETFQVNLSAAVNATIADGLGVGTIVDNDPPTISINSRTVTEGDVSPVNAVFTVSLSFAFAQPITVSYATSDGTASAPTMPQWRER
jgi:hypothetical protein